MAELFIELFSEEIPVKLQIDARTKIKRWHARLRVRAPARRGEGRRKRRKEREKKEEEEKRGRLQGPSSSSSGSQSQGGGTRLPTGTANQPPHWRPKKPETTAT